MNLLDIQQANTKPKNRAIVRVITSSYFKGNSLVIEKKVTPLKRKSYGYHPLIEGKYEILDDMEYGSGIINLHEVCDGIYQLVMCNLGYDCESGMLDEWDWQLVEYKEELKYV